MRCLRSNPLLESLKNVSPRGFEAPTQTIKVVNGHIPLPSLDSLQGAAVNIGFFGQLFLGELRGVS